MWSQKTDPLLFNEISCCSRTIEKFQLFINCSQNWIVKLSLVNKLVQSFWKKLDNCSFTTDSFTHTHTHTHPHTQIYIYERKMQLVSYWAVQWSWFAQVNALCNLLCKKSREVAASLLGWFVGRCCFTLCITMEIEPIIAKQYKCHHCCRCKNYWGKGMEGGKKVSALFFGWPEDRNFVEKMCFGASYSTSNKLLLVARHILTMSTTLRASKNAFKIGSVKFANSLSLPSIVKRVRTRSKSS